jgi:hypothetical protein
MLSFLSSIFFQGTTFADLEKAASVIGGLEELLNGQPEDVHFAHFKEETYKLAFIITHRHGMFSSSAITNKLTHN